MHAFKGQKGSRAEARGRELRAADRPDARPEVAGGARLMGLGSAEGASPYRVSPPRTTEPLLPQVKRQRANATGLYSGEKCTNGLKYLQNVLMSRLKRPAQVRSRRVTGKARMDPATTEGTAIRDRAWPPAGRL